MDIFIVFVSIWYLIWKPLEDEFLKHGVFFVFYKCFCVSLLKEYILVFLRRRFAVFIGLSFLN